MPKMKISYPDHVNFLAGPDTVMRLTAIAYFRGQRGRYAEPLRDFVEAGIREFIAGLKPAERRQYEEILENLRITADNRAA